MWTNPDRFVSTVPAHDVRAVVSQGNVLLVVWREDLGVGQNGIWYSYSVLDVPELSVVPLATDPADFSVQNVGTAVVPELGVSTPEPTLRPELLEEAPPSDLGGNPLSPSSSALCQ
ncbi:MAG: hypothetical protein MZW92_75900 [Comamonadaceae bacterium]|nr:hypothetical protein [Comamonadaceae bacterium]